MATIMEKLTEILTLPGWRDNVAEEFERVTILDEGAADMDEKLDVCRHLHLLSTLCRRGRKVGFSDEGTRMNLSSEAGILAFERCIEICGRLKAEGCSEFKITDQLSRSYYGIADLLLRAAKTCADDSLRRRLLEESLQHAQNLQQELQGAVQKGADAQTRDFAEQYVLIGEMLMEKITDSLKA